MPKLDYSSENTVVSDKSKAILDSITNLSMQSEHENKDGRTRGLLGPSEPYWLTPTAFLIRGPGMNQRVPKMCFVNSGGVNTLW